MLELTIVLVVLVIAAESFRRLETAKPNEWLLVIDNGELKKAGIGQRAFRWPWHQVVRFSSSITKVPFKAQQVTREMQGLEVSGFVIWVVYREEEGPFKAYKYLAGLGDEGNSAAIDENIARMAESIIRHQVANSTIHEVITNRDALRQKVRAEMLEVVKGWGVWLETVEITDVMILSSSLFQDLQAPYREKAHGEAESIRLASRIAIQEETLEADTEMARKQSVAKTERAVHEAQQQLERLQEEEKLFAEKARIELERQASEHRLDQQRLSDELELEEQRGRQLMAAEKARLQLEATMSPVNLQKAALDTAERIYKELPVDSVKLINFGQNQGPEALVAQLTEAMRASSTD